MKINVIRIHTVNTCKCYPVYAMSSLIFFEAVRCGHWKFLYCKLLWLAKEVTVVLKEWHVFQPVFADDLKWGDLMRGIMILPTDQKLDKIAANICLDKTISFPQCQSAEHSIIERLCSQNFWPHPGGAKYILSLKSRFLTFSFLTFSLVHAQISVFILLCLLHIQLKTIKLLNKH